MPAVGPVYRMMRLASGYELSRAADCCAGVCWPGIPGGWRCSGSRRTAPAPVHGSSGSVNPVRTINNPGLNGTYWDPWTVTLDSSANVYVQTFLSDSTTFVFPPGSSGPPTRVFRVTGPDSQSVAVDTNGYEYVMGGESSPQIFVAAPQANGDAANLYTVSPVRQFSTGRLFVPGNYPTTTMVIHR